MGTQSDAGREFWRGVLMTGGFTAIPRWTFHPRRRVDEHAAPISDELVAGLRRWADELAVSVSAMLLAAHAKVLSALSGEGEVATGYVPARATDQCGARCGPARVMAGY